jgi:DNA-binding SARP family transcriptional activator
MMETDGDQSIASSTLAISLLGPLEIRRGAATIQVPQNKHRVVIAVLALRMGTVVSVDDLITYLWTNHPPATAKKTLQGYVARIRRLLGRDVVTTHPSGYALTAARVDVIVFEQLLDLAKSHSDQSRRLARLRKALALVRGEPLADIWSERLQQGPGASLTERWLEAIEHRIDSEIEAGNHENVLPELHELLAAHPLREPFWRQFMHALYRAGQQAEALSAFRRMRGMLITELGVEPSPSVCALHAQILAHDPVLMKPYSRARDLYGYPGRGGCTASLPSAARTRQAHLCQYCRHVRGPAHRRQS